MYAGIYERNGKNVLEEGPSDLELAAAKTAERVRGSVLSSSSDMLLASNSEHLSNGRTLREVGNGYTVELLAEAKRSKQLDDMIMRSETLLAQSDTPRRIELPFEVEGGFRTTEDGLPLMTVYTRHDFEEANNWGIDLLASVTR